MNGKVKWFSTEKGFGFIFVVGQDDHFFHISDFIGEDLPGEGDLVTFIPVLGKKGKPAASEIKKITNGRRDRSKSPYYGKPTYKKVDIYDNHTGAGAAGGGLLGLLVAGPLGAVIGAVVGGIHGSSDISKVGEKEVEITSKCIRCGGIAQVTGMEGKIIGFQCPDCSHFWKERKKSSFNDYDGYINLKEYMKRKKQE